MVPSVNSRRSLSLFFTSGYWKWSLKQFALVTDALQWPEKVQKLVD